MVQIGATFGQKAIENKKGPKRDYIQGFANPYKETKVSKAERLRERFQKELMVKAEDILEKLKKGMLQ